MAKGRPATTKIENSVNNPFVITRDTDKTHKQQQLECCRLQTCDIHANHEKSSFELKNSDSIITPIYWASVKLTDIDSSLSQFTNHLHWIRLWSCGNSKKNQFRRIQDPIKSDSLPIVAMILVYSIHPNQFLFNRPKKKAKLLLEWNTHLSEELGVGHLILNIEGS